MMRSPFLVHLWSWFLAVVGWLAGYTVPEGAVGADMVLVLPQLIDFDLRVIIRAYMLGSAALLE